MTPGARGSLIFLAAAAAYGGWIATLVTAISVQAWTAAGGLLGGSLLAVLGYCVTTGLRDQRATAQIRQQLATLPPRGRYPLPPAARAARRAAVAVPDDAAFRALMIAAGAGELDRLGHES